MLNLFVVYYYTHAINIHKICKQGLHMEIHLAHNFSLVLKNEN